MATYKRSGGEGDEAVDRKTHHAARAVLRLPAVPCRRGVRYRDGTKTGPPHETPEEPRSLPDLPERLHHSAVEQAEIGGIGRDVDSTQGAEYPIIWPNVTGWFCS